MRACRLLQRLLLRVTAAFGLVLGLRLITACCVLRAVPHTGCYCYCLLLRRLIAAAAC